MKKWMLFVALCILFLAGCGEEERVTGYGDTSVHWAPIPGYTEEQSDAIKKELTERIVYNPPSGDASPLGGLYTMRSVSSFLIASLCSSVYPGIGAQCTLVSP